MADGNTPIPGEPTSGPASLPSSSPPATPSGQVPIQGEPMQMESKGIVRGEPLGFIAASQDPSGERLQSLMESDSGG